MNVQRPTFNAERSSAGKFDLEERLLEYAVRIIRLVEALPHREAQAAESRADFVHKLKVCLKELRESLRWLRLVRKVPLVKAPSKVDPLLKETEELIRVFFKSIRTAQERGLTCSKLNVERSVLGVER